MTEHTSSITRRTVLKGLGSAVGAASLSGCLTGEARPLSASNSMRITQALPPQALDPVEVTDQWTKQVAGRVFEGLYAYDRNVNAVPVLADGPPEETGETTYEVGIDPNARFQNGDSVTATDVAYSLEAPVAEETTNAPALEPIETVEPVDQTTVELHLAHPYPALEDALTQPIVPKSERADAPDSFGEEKPVGSGPYEVHSIAPEKHVKLSRWDDYWGEPEPSVDHVTVLGNHSGLARTMSLKTGQADLVEDVQPKLWQTTKTMPAASVTRTPSFRYYYLGFNCNDGPMVDPETRKAVDALLDLDEVVDHFVGPAGTRQYGPLPPRMAEAWNMPTDEWRRIPARKNVKRATQILSETVKQDESTPSGWQPTIAVPKHDMLRAKVGQQLVQGFAEAGFRRARVEKYAWSEFREKTTTGSSADYDVFVGAWTGGPDPDTFAYPLFHENAEGITNGTFYQDEAVMEAIATARKTTKREERQRRYEDAITTLLEDRVHLPAFSLFNTWGVKLRVEGFEPHPIPSANPELAGPGGVVSLA